MNLKEKIDKVVSETLHQEATYLEARLRELVGTGLDLAVFRIDPVIADHEETVTIASAILCFPVSPGSRPEVKPGQRCTIYEVSKYNGPV